MSKCFARLISASTWAPKIQYQFYNFHTWKCINRAANSYFYDYIILYEGLIFHRDRGDIFKQPFCPNSSPTPKYIQFKNQPESCVLEAEMSK